MAIFISTTWIYAILVARDEKFIAPFIILHLEMTAFSSGHPVFKVISCRHVVTV
jgi:hypothetical protein